MRSRALWRTDPLARGDERTNPFRRPFRWDLAPGGARLQLIADDMPPVTFPVRPVMIIGVAGMGARTTMDAIVQRAATDHWSVARMQARPGHRLHHIVAEALDSAVETMSRDAPGDIGVARMRMIVEEFRRSIDADESAYSAVLGELAAASADRCGGMIVCVDDLNAADPSEACLLLRAFARVATPGATLRVVVSTTQRGGLDASGDPTAAWNEVSLHLTRDDLAEVVDRAALGHERQFTAKGIDALAQASQGVAEIAFDHARLAWDDTFDTRIDTQHVAAVRERADLARATALRAQWSARLSLGQRRYLRALVDRGIDGVAPDDMLDAFGDVARVGLSPATLDSVLAKLVQLGLVVVHDGCARVALPGLAAIL